MFIATLFIAMDAYLNPIQQLLTCPDGDEGRILNENREWVNGEFLLVCEIIAEQMEQEGRENEAQWLRQLVRKVSRREA
ncbi:hypothetical protein [Roseofilum capinflatum]|uniref:Uncharacterized protein n=1 Tax=Roseofilum capinflatum BLCC-M114 TaxID=3022440 RepID=A0ABT7BA40_9CYAN|nr:hypothetical protein [Roseofilum capinflatum]MDJ1176026.1 hypothetical protein [Roseofilum capinflatum BLCC-M114]